MSQSSSSSYFAQRPMLMVAGLFLLAAVPLGFMVLLTVGQIRGSEFSPDDFTRRSFDYQQIPWVKWTLSGIEYSDTTPELGQTLMTEGLIETPTGFSKTTRTWHLYEDSFVPNSHDCDARFLTEYLDHLDWDDATSVSTPFWITWNKNFPKSARVLWPTVADLARHELYLLLPPIMRLATDRTEDNAVAFQKEIDGLAAAAWFELGKVDFQLGNFNRAAERLSRANLIEPADETAMLLDLCAKEVADFEAIAAGAVKAKERLDTRITMLLAKSESEAETDVQAEADES